MGERRHPLQVMLINRAFGQVKQTLAQIAPKVDRPVPVDSIVLDLYLIQHRPDLVRRKRGMVQVDAELIESLFEVDIVLPKSIVGIEDQVLAVH